MSVRRKDDRKDTSTQRLLTSIGELAEGDEVLPRVFMGRAGESESPREEEAEAAQESERRGGTGEGPGSKRQGLR